MKAGVLFSGGKDSCYAMFLAQKQGYEIACLMTVIPESKESYMFHYPNVRLTEFQAKAMGVPWLSVYSAGEKEQELDDLENLIGIAKKKYKIGGVVSGAIQSSYQKTRVDRLCDKAGLKSIAPLWNIEHEEYMQGLILNKFRVVITGIAAEGLTKEFLGKEIDRNMLEKLKKINLGNKMHLAGEGGEYESFVLDGPMFKLSLRITDSETQMEDENTGFLKIKNISLIKK